MLSHCRINMADRMVLLKAMLKMEGYFIVTQSSMINRTGSIPNKADIKA